MLNLINTARELGYNGCISYRHDFQMYEFQTWIREKYRLNIWIDCGIHGEQWIWTINFIDKGTYIQSDDKGIYFSSYEDAFMMGLKCAMENIKNL